MKTLSIKFSTSSFQKPNKFALQPIKTCETFEHFQLRTFIVEILILRRFSVCKKLFMSLKGLVLGFSAMCDFLPMVIDLIDFVKLSRELKYIVLFHGDNLQEFAIIFL